MSMEMRKNILGTNGTFNWLDDYTQRLSIVMCVNGWKTFRFPMARTVLAKQIQCSNNKAETVKSSFGVGIGQLFDGRE